MSNITLLLLLLCASLLSSVQSQPNSCDGFSFTGTSLASNITSCKKLRSLGFEFGWNYIITNTSNSTTNATVDVIFSAKPPLNGWVAWGVNPRRRARMVGTRAIIAFVLPNRTAVVNTYNVTADTKLGCDFKPSPLDVKVSHIKVNNSGEVITVAATVSLPSTRYDVSELNHVWQMGPMVIGGERPAGHAFTLENFDSRETINLTSGVATTHRHPNVRAVHAFLSVIGWGIFTPSGAIIIRYFRVFPFEIKRCVVVHVGFQIVAYTLGTIGWGYGLTMGNVSGHFKSFMRHRILGIFIFTLATMQMMALWLKPHGVDKYRKYWSIYHHFLGYALLAMIITNIFKGFAILRPPQKWKIAYVDILIVLGSIAMGMEILTWIVFYLKRKEKAKGSAPGTKAPGTQQMKP